MAADQLSVHLVRDAQGRASWAIGQNNTAIPADHASAPPRLPIQPGVVLARDGRLVWDDAPLQLALDLRFQAIDSRAPPTATAGPATGLGTDLDHLALQARASGRYRGEALSAMLRTGALRPWLPGGRDDQTVPLQLQLVLGATRLQFDGEAADAAATRLRGRYALSGPSLAAAGRPLGLTLPTTATFAVHGNLARNGRLWQTLIDQARIGRSQFDGALSYDTATTPGLLAGRLHAAVLHLADLGPAIGTGTPPASAGAGARQRPSGQPPDRPSGRVLPDRAFDLPSLRAMDANVLLRMDRLDFGGGTLRDAAALNAHLLLNGGVLRLQDLEADLALGRVRGQLEMDARQSPARWSARLRASGLRLEQWVRALQRPGQPAYASGRLATSLELSGRGRSTAELLATANGHMTLNWTQGTLSHLLVEAAGLDIAEGLGLLLRGDDNLAVHCGLAELQVQNGRVTPRVFIVDTADSRLWLSGQLSLADERLALVARVQPKDFSPLTLRAPLHIGGELGAPTLNLDRKTLASRAVPAALLAMAHPLAALIPLLDAGESASADGPGPDATRSCRRL
ncbi:MAG: AsmA family protein [Burkholderiaceae bacterium]|nr:AsmA family protein [Burkholderiaceae bacterium]